MLRDRERQRGGGRQAETDRHRQREVHVVHRVAQEHQIRP